MAKYTIYAPDGGILAKGRPTYNGTFGQPAYLEFSEIASPEYISWEIGSYVDYEKTGFRYRLYTLPDETKQARLDTVGNAFVYKNVKFFAATKDLEMAPFRDIVLGQDSSSVSHFSSAQAASTYEDVYGIARRLQANMDRYAGPGVWRITVYTPTRTVATSEYLDLLNTPKEISFNSGDSCLAVLNSVYSTWKGIGWVYRVLNGVNVISIGRPNLRSTGNTTNPFAYGKLNRLTSIRKAVSNKVDFATRIIPFGSEKNMISRYYNNVVDSKGNHIRDNEAVFIPNLMLPLEDWGETEGKKDPYKAYIENQDAINTYGLIEKVLYFDGNNNLDDIHPSIEGVTAGDVRSIAGEGEYLPSEKYADDDRLDMVLDAVNPTDNGDRSTGDGGKYIFDINEDISGEHLSTDTYASGAGVLVEQTVATVPITVGGKLSVSIDSSIKVMPMGPDGQTELMFDEVDGGKINLYIDGDRKKAYDVDVVPTRYGYCVIYYSGKLTADDVPDNASMSISISFRASVSQSWKLKTELYDAKVVGGVGTSLENAFRMKIPQVGFDLNDQQQSVSNGIATISMKSGACGGRQFTVKGCSYDRENDAWDLVVFRSEDTSLDQWFPSKVYPIKAGDQFVILDIQMPEIYTKSAAQRLKKAAESYLEEASRVKYIYEPILDPKALIENDNSIYVTDKRMNYILDNDGRLMIFFDSGSIPLTEGVYMHISDDNILVEDVYVLINSIVINEGESSIPTYRITLMDEKNDTFMQRVEKGSNAIASRLNTLVRSSQRVSLSDKVE